jgi:uncharacterized protein
MNEWDEAKRAANLAKHGVDFVAVERFDWATAMIWRDDRFQYGEERFIALGRIGMRLHAMVFTMRAGRTRIIGLRKANAREVRQYEKRTEEA